MIYYETEDWVSLIFRVKGTVWERVWWKWLLISSYILASYCFCYHTGSDLGRTKSNILGSTLSFLLVFRANTGYQRYWEGRTVLTRLFCDLREVIALAFVCLPGGAGYQKLRWRRRLKGPAERDMENPVMDMQDNHVCQERVNIVRWSLVLAICVQLHTRILEEGLTHSRMQPETKWCIDWDRYRIRHLTTQEEFRGLDAYVRNLVEPRSLWDSPALDTHLSGVQGSWDRQPPDSQEDYQIDARPAMRLPMVALMKLNQIIHQCISDPRSTTATGGMPERFTAVFIGFSTRIQQAYTDISQVISTPLPFPYFHLCKTLLFLQFLAYPFFIEHRLGFWANVVEQSFLTLALLGVDAIAIELENPFGSDDNDLDIYEKIANLEEEIMFFLDVSGDRRCRDSFQWLDMPEALTGKCVSTVAHFLALRTMVEHDGKTTATAVGLEPTTGSVPVPDHAFSRNLDEEASDYSDDDSS